MSAKTVAVTGATGFVGSTLLKIASGQGLQIRALTRRPQPEMAGVTWIEGALDNQDSLARLVEGVDAVIHVAGVVNAPTRDGFEQGNIRGTRAIVAATEAAGVTRFVHVSSLAAREPRQETSRVRPEERHSCRKASETKQRLTV